jgi:hypothetical protein
VCDLFQSLFGTCFIKLHHGNSSSLNGATEAVVATSPRQLGTMPPDLMGEDPFEERLSIT